MNAKWLLAASVLLFVPSSLTGQAPDTAAADTVPDVNKPGAVDVKRWKDSVDQMMAGERAANREMSERFKQEWKQIEKMRGSGHSATPEVGWTERDVLVRTGLPDRTDRQQTSDGLHHETWWYEDYGSTRLMMVTFDQGPDGKLRVSYVSR